ncbi:hypothetical protein NSQ29_01460 [Paenibacillus sp. FSL F4-0236]|uniref:hypothetical protein n=1 Tax=Paenibacillus sp. FSL F4-0236 TaxID=2954731 RepID=UPI0030FBBC3B
MKQIHPEHLAFVDEAAKAFEERPNLAAYINESETLIGVRSGADRDSVRVYHLGEGVALFTQQVDVRVPRLRKEVARFTVLMEEQLRANEDKGGWENATQLFLKNELEKNFRRLWSCGSHEEFRRRCANIANFAMMLADNDIREENDRRVKPDGS